MDNVNNHSTKKNPVDFKQTSWQRITQKLKSLLSNNSDKKQPKQEIDYYHEYVFPKKIEIMQKSNKRRRDKRME